MATDSSTRTDDMFSSKEYETAVKAVDQIDFGFLTDNFHRLAAKHRDQLVADAKGEAVVGEGERQQLKEEQKVETAAKADTSKEAGNKALEETTLEEKTKPKASVASTKADEDETPKAKPEYKEVSATQTNENDGKNANLLKFEPHDVAQVQRILRVKDHTLEADGIAGLKTLDASFDAGVSKDKNDKELIDIGNLQEVSTSRWERHDNTHINDIGAENVKYVQQMLMDRGYLDEDAHGKPDGKGGGPKSMTRQAGVKADILYENGGIIAEKLAEMDGKYIAENLGNQKDTAVAKTKDTTKETKDKTQASDTKPSVETAVEVDTSGKEGYEPKTPPKTPNQEQNTKKSAPAVRQ